MNFHTLPQTCRDIILDYWSVVKEIHVQNEPFYHYTQVGYVLGMTNINIHEYYHVMDHVKQFALLDINKSLQRHAIKEELEYHFLEI